jgi:hypothetical protein
MEKQFNFNNGETVNIKMDFNIENNTFLTQMVFIGLDKEEKQATVSFQSKAERDVMFENYGIESAEQFANFIRGN